MQPETKTDTLRLSAILSVSNGTATILSTTVAELFDKQHKHVLEAIRGFETGMENAANGPNFRPVEYQDSKGEMRPAYQMTRDGFFFLTLGFTGKRAEEWRWKVIRAFNAMEEELRRFRAAGLRLNSPALVDALFGGQVSVFTAKQIQSLSEEELIRSWVRFATQPRSPSRPHPGTPSVGFSFPGGQHHGFEPTTISQPGHPTNPAPTRLVERGG
jgi:Rha family phage regulatory protein